MLKYRLIFGILLIAALLGLIYGDERLALCAAACEASSMTCLGLSRCDGAMITLVLAAMVALGTREMRHLLIAAGHQPVAIWPAVVNIALLLIPFLAANASSDATAAFQTADSVSTLTWLIIGFMGSAFLVARRSRIDGAIGDLATTLLIICYLGVLPQYLLRLRLAQPEGGAWLLLYFLATIKLCDIGAFFTGRSLGRHKLIEWLSPKKTVEGLAGGIAASILAAVVIPIAVRRWAPESPVATVLPEPQMAALFGLAMALVGQAGDLLESLFKRDAGAKDSANAIPAFGGVLDVLDSPLLAAPVAYWILLS